MQPPLSITWPGVNTTSGLDFETIAPTDFTNQILNKINSWLSLNPTRRPQYVVLMLDCPSRLNWGATNGGYFPFYAVSPILPSVSVQLATDFPGWSPFITHINMGDTNACYAYIDKLANIGTNFLPGSLLLSASARRYGNTNYYFDNTRPTLGSPNPAEIGNSTNGLLSVNPQASVIYTNVPYGGDNLSDHITRGTNVAGYMSWGYHGTSAQTNYGYATNGTLIFTGNSGWHIIETIESYNGQRYQGGTGTFVMWYANIAFGATGYLNTPVGAVSHVDEPQEPNVNDGSYFALWEIGKNFGQCAWYSRRTIYFQAIGDPFVTK